MSESIKAAREFLFENIPDRLDSELNGVYCGRLSAKDASKKCDCKSFTARPDEGDKDAKVRLSIMRREAEAFICAKADTVYWNTVQEKEYSAPDVAKMIAEFTLNILDLKDAKTRSQLAAERTRREEAEAKVEMDGRFIAGMLVLVKPVLKKDPEFLFQVRKLAAKFHVTEELAQDSSSTSESGADLEEDDPGSETVDEHLDKIMFP